MQTLVTIMGGGKNYPEMGAAVCFHTNRHIAQRGRAAEYSEQVTFPYLGQVLHTNSG